MGRPRNTNASRHLITMSALLFLGMVCPATPGFTAGPPHHVDDDAWVAPEVRWLQGRTHTLRADQSIQAALDASVAEALVQLGGTVVLAGHASTACQMTLDMVGETHRIKLGPRRRVVAINIAWAPSPEVEPAINWSLTTTDCDASVEGVLLFVGDAAAYVDRDPEHYWRRHAGNRGAMLTPAHPATCDWTRATALRWPR